MASNRTVTGLIKPVDSHIMSQRKKMTVSEYSFPSNLGPHSIVLNFSSYDFDRSKGTMNRLMNTSIALPLPQNLMDSFNVRVSANELGFAGAGAANLRSSTDVKRWTAENANITEDFLMKELGAHWDAAGNFSSTAEHLAMRHLVAQFHSGAAKGFEVGSGMAINPHIALSFDGVDLKHHSFEWVLSPRNAQESDTIRKIINKIKYSMAPEYATLQEASASPTENFLSKVFLKYPSVVDVFFLGTEPGYLFYFKRCMVAQMTTDYAGSGQLAFVENGRPATVKLQVNLTETEIHTKDDYADE